MSLEDSGSLEDLARRSMATAVDELLDEVPGLVNEVALQGAPSSSSLGVTRGEESEEKPDTPSSSNLGMTRDEEPERESDAPRARSLLDEVCAHLAGQFGAPLTVEQRGEVEQVITGGFKKAPTTKNQVLNHSKIPVLLGNWRYAQIGRARPKPQDKAPRGVDPKTYELVKATISAKLTTAPSGNAKDLLRGKPAKGRTSMAVMDESAASTGGKIHIAWSGGAGDCIIIGAYSASKRKAIVEHADQTTGKVGFDGIDTCEVYLASQKFGGEAPAADGLVVRVINGLLARKANIVAIYTTSRLAIRDDGTVLADFDSKDLADESTRDVNETMQGWGMGKKTE